MVTLLLELVDCWTGLLCDLIQSGVNGHFLWELYLTAFFIQEDADGNIEVLPAVEKAPGKVQNALRITTPYMTKYERARVLGTRALQIA